MVHDFTDVPALDRFCWSRVVPGDLVRCPGTIAYRASEFTDRTDETHVLKLAQRWVLVLARLERVPGEPDDHRVFVLLSRHGIIVTVCLNDAGANSLNLRLGSRA